MGGRTSSLVAVTTMVAVVVSSLVISTPAQAAAPCPPYSSLDCDDLLVEPGFAFEFDAAAGGLVDKAGVGTGFTLTQPSSASPEYLPAQLEVAPTAPGLLRVTTTPGIQFTTNNTLDNGLGVALATPVDPIEVTTRILDIPGGNNQSEQAGVWLGTDQDNLVKLVAVSRAPVTTGGAPRFNVQLAREVAGVVGTSNEINMPAGTTFPVGADVDLSLTVDPVARTATGRYTIDGGTQQTLGTLPLPTGVLNGVNPPLPGAGTAAGIFTTSRNRTAALGPLTFDFDRFAVQSLAVPAAPGAVTATAGADDVTIVWDAVDDPAVTGYQVFAGTSPVAVTGEPLAVLDASTTTWTDDTILLDRSRAYAVRAMAGPTPSAAVESPTVTPAGPAGESFLRVDVVDVTPATNPGPVAGYVADSGLGYDGTRGYGWLSASARPDRVPVDGSINTRQRPGLVTAWGQRRASLIHLQSNPGTVGITTDQLYWEAAVPDGRYAVAVTVGDDGGGTTPVFDSTHSIDVEGTPAIEGFVGSVARVFDEAVVEVEVTDGFLTVDADGGTNTKVSSIDVYQIEEFEAPDTEAPVTPTGLAAVAGDGQVSLSWDAVSDAELYRVFAGEAGAVDLVTPVYEGAAAEAVVTDLVNGTGYEFVVAAVDAAGNVSEVSAAVAATPEAVADTEAPVTPTGLAAVAGDGQVSLTWDEVSDAELYRVFRGTLGIVSFDEPVAEVTDPAHLDTDVMNGVDYVYAVVAVDAAGNVSPPTPAVAATPVDGSGPTAPTGLAAVLDGTTATLSWDAVGDADLDHYEVYERGDQLTGGAFDDTLLRDDVTATEVQIEDLAPGSVTTYFVVSVDTAGDVSAASSTVTVSVPVAEVCPSTGGWVGEYFAGSELSGLPVERRCDVAVDFDFGTGGPGIGGVGDDNFSIRWTRTIDVAEAGSYRFSSRTDDGVRVIVDGEVRIDRFYPQSATETVEVVVPLTAGPHDVEVQYFELSGAASAQVGYERVEVDSSCEPDQWRADYFDGVELEGAPLAGECVSEISEAWGQGGPDGLGDDRFSARWTRTFSGEGEYSISTRTDDGVRVRVNGELVIDRWYPQGGEETTLRSLTLPPGTHTFVVEYFELTGGALAEVDVVAPEPPTSDCLPVDGWDGSYFATPDFQGEPVTRCDPVIDFDFGTTGPGLADIGGSNFSVRWSRAFSPATDTTYELLARSDDGIRVIVDGAVVLDRFYPQSATETYSVSIPLTAGDHTVVVEYNQLGGSASARVSLTPVDVVDTCRADQWTVSYFASEDLSGPVADTVCLDTVDENWGDSSPEGLPSNSFSARLTRVYEGAGTYDVTVRSDDGVRVSVDGTSVLDRWFPQSGETEVTEQVTLPEGPHTFVAEYFERSGGALLEVAVDEPTTVDPAPAAPVDVTATALDASVVLSWTAGDAGTVGYRVYRSDDSPVDLTAPPISGVDAITLTTLTDTDVTAGESYTYVVVAVDGAGQTSGPSTEVTVSIPSAPPQVTEAWVFQPAGTVTAPVPVPAGFTGDFGLGYDTSAGRGWVTEASLALPTATPIDASAATRLRPDRPGVAPELNRLIHLTRDDCCDTGFLTDIAWERALPNGSYQVSVSAGDIAGAGGVYDSQHLVRAEGQTVLPSFQATVAEEFRTGTATVVVSDGKLTIDAIGGFNTKINWVRISSAGPDTTAPASVQGLVGEASDSRVVLDWTPSPEPDVAGYRVYRSQTLPVSTDGDGLGGAGLVSAATFVDTTAENLQTYRYAVVAVDTSGNRSEPTTSAELTPEPFAALSVGIDFGILGMTPEVGYLLDYGQAYGPRTGANEGSGLTYGWVDEGATTPLSLVGNGRVRGRAGIDPLLDSMIHMQYGDVLDGTNGVDAPGAWEIQVPDGVYEVTASAGDEPGTPAFNSDHAVDIENAVGIELFKGTTGEQYRSATVQVRVEDGRLTVSAVAGTNTKLTHLRVTQVDDVPAIVSVNPANRATDADTTGGVATSIAVPGIGVGVDPATIAGNVSLVQVATGAAVAGTSGSSGGNDVVNFSPTAALEPFTAYRFTVTPGVRSGDGVPFAEFTSVFTTGDGVITAPDTFDPLIGVGFEKQVVDAQAGYIASMTFGPDGRLYGSTIGSGLVRYDVAADGTLSNKTSLTPDLLGRAVIGLVFDEAATADDMGAWVTHATANIDSEDSEFSSKVSYLSGPELGSVTDVFVGLPRSRKDHLSNSIGYGPEGDLFFLQGSNQAAGDPDNAWGTRGEKLLTAALLHFDTDDARVQAALAPGGVPIDVQTDGVTPGYDPFATDAPLTIWSTGIRNAYDFSFHSNDHLYVPTNGTASGGNSPGVDVTYSGEALTSATRLTHPNTPGSAALNGQDLTKECQARLQREPLTNDRPATVLQDVPAASNHPTQRDFLFDAVKGGYYGHPNPTRCEFVLNGGSASTEGRAYTGTVPVDPNYRGVAYDFEFNKSPNGVIEYQAGTFDGQLRNRLVVVRFSNNDDLTFLQVDSRTGAVLGGQVQEGVTGVPGSQIAGVGGFNDPLEVVEDPRNGNLYVNSYDRSGANQGLFLLKVPSDQQAPAVTADVDELVFSSVKSGTDGPRQVEVTNTGSDPVTLTSSVTGPNAGNFQLLSGGSGLLQPGQSSTVAVQFMPSGTLGYREAQLQVAAGDSTVSVGLYGLSANGEGGANEPTLTDVLRTLGHPVGVGWSGLVGGVDPAPTGDEVEVELFEQVSPGSVKMTAIASYAPFEELPFGWYTGNGTAADRTEVGAIANGEQQTLLPALSRGDTELDPGGEPFGLYYESNFFGRVGYTEDRLNTGDVAHRVRIYEATRRDGSPLPNSYILGFEDAANGDYQDYVFLLSGVVPAGTDPDPDPDPEPIDAVRVNFQNAAAAVPAGYVRDFGQPFGSRTLADQGTGLRYGWIDGATQVDLDLSVGGTTPGNGRERNAVSDQRLDTLMHMQAGSGIAGTFNGTKADGVWELELTNGTYEVTVAAGDPNVNPDPESHVLVVEDVRAIDGFVPSGAVGSATRSTTATVEVEVSDGRLSIDPADGLNTKIHYVDVVPVDTAPSTLQVNFQAAGAATPAGWQADDGFAYSDARGYGWLNLATRTPVDRTAAARTRAGSGNILDRTFNIMQSDVSATANPEGAWEIEVPDGAYDVQVSVGDPSFVDSVHSVDAEGVRIIGEFVPSGLGDYQVSSQTVSVADGRLTLTPGFGGSNTKIQWVRITPADAGTDVIDPTLDIAVSGEAAPGGAYYDEAVVTVVASDSGGSGLAEVVASVDGAPAVPYTDALTVTGAGDHTVTVTATDGAGNSTTESVEFTVVVIQLGDGVLTSQNPEAAPFADRYVMSRTESTIQDPSLTDSTTVLLRNTGTEPVTITGMEAPAEGFVVTTAITFPVIVPVNGTLSVGVDFVGTSPGTANKIFEEELAFVSDAANGPVVTVELAGIAQDRAEGGAEPDVAEIAQAFGWGTTIVGPGQQLNNQGRLEAIGDEVLEPYWQRLDTTKPVTVRQLAAYHSCCASTATFFTHAKGSNTTQNRLVHNGAWAQSLLPRINGSTTAPAVASFTPASATFGFKIDPEWSDHEKNNISVDDCGPGVPSGVETDTCSLGHHLRIWPVEDRAGVPVPGSYLVVMDYSGINYDFNDNAYLVTNLTPEPEPDTTAPAAPATASAALDGTAVDVTWAAVTAADLGGYHVERSTNGTTWTRLTTSPATGTAFTDVTAVSGQTYTYRVLAVDTTGNASAPTVTGAVTVPQPEPGTFTPIRVNAGGPAITAGGLQWAADTGSTGGKTYTNPAVTQIAGTTADPIYLTERSSTANLGSFSYGFEVPTGDYLVRLHFAEIYHGATGGGAGGTGKRVLSVNAEGGPVEVANLDLNAVAAPMTAVIREVPVTVTDGTLNLAFTATVNQPKVSAIEVIGVAVAPPDTTPPPVPGSVQASLSGQSVAVSWAAVTAADLAGYHVERSSGGAFTRLTTSPVTTTTFTDTTPPVGTALTYRVLSVDTSGNVSGPSTTATATVPAPPPPTFTPIRVNSGGPAVSAGGVQWAADSGFTGGKSYTNAAVTQIAGTTADPIYLNERSSTANLGSFSYGFAVPSGDYVVRLHLAELFHGATGGGAGGAGKRVFSVNAEGGSAEVANLDLNAVAAPMTAVIREVPVTVTDGTLNLAFTATVNQPSVGAIEVFQAGAVAPVPGAAAPPPAVQTAFTFAAMPSQPVANSEAQSVVIGSRVYSVGGFDSAKACCTPTSRAYSWAPGETSWTALPPLPHLAGNGAPGTGATHAGITTDGEDLFLAGGYVSGNGTSGQTFGTDEVYRFDVSTGTWSALPDLPQASASGVLGYMAGALHFAGGTNPARTADRTTHVVLDPGATSWRTAAPLPAGRNHTGAAVAGDGRWYVVGGQTGHDGTSTTHADVWSYSTASNSWRTEPSIGQARGHAGVFALDGDLVVAGGMPVHNTATANVERFRPGSASWLPMTPLPQARASGVAGALSAGRWFYSTGSTAAGSIATPQ